MTDEEKSRWEELKAQGRSYIDASQHTRGTIREASLMSVLNDAQEQIAHGNLTGANESINIAKLLAIEKTSQRSRPRRRSRSKRGRQSWRRRTRPRFPPIPRRCTMSKKTESHLDIARGLLAEPRRAASPLPADAAIGQDSCIAVIKN